MIKIITKDNISSAVINQLFNFTYRESLTEIFNNEYLSKTDISNPHDAMKNMYQDYDEFISDFLNCKNGEQIIALYEVDSKYVSALRCSQLEEGNWLIEGLETTADYRKQGYGSNLVRSLIDYLKSKNASAVCSNIGFSNEESLSLHKRLGFKVSNELAVDKNGNVYRNQKRLTNTI